jgi:hypothetical protein
MGRILALIAALLVCAACGSDPINSPEQVAADNAKYGTGPTIAADEQQALDAVSPACSETPDKLDAEASKTVELLAEKGVHDETTVTVLRHLRQSIPASAPVMNCATVLAPYITMRTGG